MEVRGLPAACNKASFGNDPKIWLGQRVCYPFHIEESSYLREGGNVVVRDVKLFKL
jgi:hypothetical protein